MNSFKTFAIATATALLVPAAAQASVTLNMNGLGFFYQANGTDLLPVGSTVVLLADDDGNGNFGDLTDPTSFDGAGESAVLARFALNGNVAGSGTSNAAILFDLVNGVNAGDDMLLVWYDTAFDAGATGPGENVNFGTYRTDSVQDFSDIGWDVPQDGTYTLNVLTLGLDGDGPGEEAGIAQFVTVPEPASAMLVAISGGLLALRRRNRNA